MNMVGIPQGSEEYQAARPAGVVRYGGVDHLAYLIARIPGK